MEMVECPALHARITLASCINRWCLANELWSNKNGYKKDLRYLVKYGCSKCELGEERRGLALKAGKQILKRKYLSNL